MAPAQCPRQVLIWTLPALAVLISLFWYKRKKSLRSDPGGTTLEKSSELVDSHNLNLSCVTSVDSDKVIAAIEKAKRDIETSRAIEEINFVEDEEEEIAGKADIVDSENSVQEVLEIKKDNFVDLTSSPKPEKEISKTFALPTPINTDYQETTITSDSVVVVDEEEPVIDNSVEFDDTIVISSTDSSFDEKNRPVDEEVIEISSDSILSIESTPDKKDSESSKSDSSVCELVEEKKDSSFKPVVEEICVKSNASNVENTVESPSKTNRINKVSGSKKRSNKKPAKDNIKTNKVELKDNKKEEKLKEKKVVLNGDCSIEGKSNGKIISSSIKSDKVKENKMELACSRVEQLGHNSSSTIDGNEAGLEQKLATLGLESSHNSEGGERDSANHSPAEIMLASPSMSNFSDAHSEGSSDSGKGCSDIPDISTPPPQTPAGGSSVAGDLIPSIYEFIIPQYMVGRLIGRHGVFLHDIRSKTHTHIFIKRHPDTTKLKICAIEGAQQDIDAALAMIRQKFPLRRFPNLTLEKVTFINVLPSWPLPQEQFQLQLIEGVNNDVILSSLISAGHFFLQQPMHPSYQSLSQLNMVMNSVYSSPEAPPLETPLKDAVCAAPAMGGWYRAQIIDVDEDVKTVDVRFLDYGGFLRLEASTLRKIRGDLMMLPFQAVECLLANVIPAGGDEAEWTEEARLFVQNLTCGQILQAHISEYTETGIPLVYLYAMYCGQVVVVNDELVSRGYAETTPSPPPVSSEE